MPSNQSNGAYAIGYALGGGYESDRETKRKDIQLQAAQQGMQFDEQGNLGYMQGSKEDLQAQEFSMVKQQLQELESRYIKQDTWQSLEAGLKDGNYSQFNSFLSSSPKVRDMYSQMGVQSVETFDPYNPEHLQAYQKSGFNPDVISYLTQARDGQIEGMGPEEVRSVAKSLGVAYPLVRGTDNSFSVAPINDFVASTNLLKEAKSNEQRTLFFDTIVQGQNAIKGLTSRAYEANLQKQELENQKSNISVQTEQLKLTDMQTYLEQNPGSSLADYMATMKAKSMKAESKSAMEKETEYIRENYGDEAAQEYVNKKLRVNDTTPASIKTKKYDENIVNTIKSESNTEDLFDVDYTKLSKENKTRFDELVKEDAKNIKPEEYDALSTLQAAANKLNTEDLKNTTGIVDASFNKIFDTLGMDLPTNELVQSANYNLIKNAIVKAAMGSQVTGNELERMTAQLGTEFKADKTVRVKMAETLDNLVAKYEGYKTKAPAFYARAMKDKVENMTKVSKYLKNPEGEPKTTSTKVVKTGQVVNGYQYLGGDTKDKKNWKKVD